MFLAVVRVVVKILNQVVVVLLFVTKRHGKRCDCVRSIWRVMQLAKAINLFVMVANGYHTVIMLNIMYVVYRMSAVAVSGKQVAAVL